MPRIPVIQHQKMAPGPPRATAVETPMMFPVPSVAARVVESAEKGERFRAVPGTAEWFPAAAAFFEERDASLGGISSAENKERRMARKRFLWGNRSLQVK